MNFSDIIHYWAEGKNRRNAILAYMQNNPDTKLYINRKYCRQLHLDSDLKRLVKNGVLKRHRDGMPSCRHSYLSLH